MKAEINKETKAKFFALYWGNNVVCSHPENFEKCYLNLKPLSQINDEDAIEVAKISLRKNQDWIPFEIIKWDWCWRVIVNREPSITNPSVNLEMIIKIDFDVNENEIFFEWDHIHSKGIGVEQRHLPNAIYVYDFLRSRGYVLPWMGLSVDEMVEAGWIKLI